MSGPCNAFRRGLAAAWVAVVAADDCRVFRVSVLLAVVFTCSVFDVGFTLCQWERGNFLEANALAAAVAGSPGALAGYKAALVGVGATILFSLRRRWESEVGLWLVAACHVGLMAWWTTYLSTLEVCLADPAVSGAAAAF